VYSLFQGPSANSKSAGVFGCINPSRFFHGQEAFNHLLFPKSGAEDVVRIGQALTNTANDLLAKAGSVFANFMATRNDN
jgi:hypothetical protein